MGFTKTEQDEARATLLEIVKPGDTISTVLVSVSKSGMTRTIDLYHFSVGVTGEVLKIRISRLAAMACGFGWDKKRGGAKMGGCGMDMGYHAVHELSYALFPDGFECVGTACPSNDHSNGDRDYTPHHHDSGGYALKHEWL